MEKKRFIKIGEIMTKLVIDTKKLYPEQNEILAKTLEFYNIPTTTQKSKCINKEKILKNAVNYAITELEEWNPDSEAAQELRNILKSIKSC